MMASASFPRRFRAFPSKRQSSRRRRPYRFERLEDRQLLAADLAITEFMASNDSTLLDEDGDSSDWIEVYNPTAATVSLAGWSLTDDQNKLGQWKFPDVELAPDERLIVFASKKDRRAPVDEPLRRDFVAVANGTFLVDLAEGTYDVRLTIGDYDRVRIPMALQLQGEPADTLTDTPGQFLDRTYTVQVSAETNNQLAVRLQSTRTTAGDAVINALAITPAAGGQSLQFDFGSADSAVAAGYTQVTEADSYSAQTGYGWEADSVVAGQDRGQRGLHTNFSLKKGGEYLALVRPDLTVAQDFGPKYPGQAEDVSYGIPAAGSTAAFLATATPGQPNSLERGSPVLLDRASGVFSEPFLLTLSVDAAAAIIHFTTDGTVPTEASPVYSAPIAIDATTVVKAISVEPGVATSPVASGWFMKMAADLADFSSDLPIMVFDNFASGAVTAGSFQFSAMAVFEPDAATGRSSPTATPDVTSRSGLKVRGSSTAGFAKTPLALEIWDEQNRDKDVPLLGLPAESDWVLYSPYVFDRALFRNAFIFELSNQVGRYAPRTRFVEVFRNTDGGDVSAADYVGVYVLIEKIKRGPDRVDITRLEPHDNAEPDISGGWLLKVDRADPGDRGFVSDARVDGPRYVDPKESEVTPEQAAWIRDDFNAMFASLTDTNPETGYEQYIDVDSWIDHNILNLLPMNVDAFRLSGYFYKDRGGKYEMGPIWDFDRSMGSEDGRDDRPDAWDGPPDSSKYFEPDPRHPWWGILAEDPNYMQRWTDRWFELRQGPLSEGNIAQIIDSMAAELAESQVRNFQRWPGVPPHGHNFAPPGVGGWEGEVAHLKGWLFARLAWVDSQFLPPPTISPDQSRLTPGDSIVISADPGKIYYTTDGSDPRLLTGQPSPSAIAYNPTVRLLDGSSPATTIVPTGDPAELGWQDPGFDDASWNAAQAAIGFDTGTVDAAIRVLSDFTVREVASTRAISTLTTADAVLAGQDVASESTGTFPRINFLDGEMDGHFADNQLFPNGGGDNFVVHATATIEVSAAGTYTFGINSDEGARLRIDDKNVIVDNARHFPEDRFGTVFLTQGTHELDLVMFERSGNAEVELFFVAGEQWQFGDQFQLLGEETDTPFHSLIRTDVEAEMAGISASAYLRIPFAVPNVADVEGLFLKVQYDDGLVVSLNGTEVVRRNAPELVGPDAAATTARADLLAVVAEVIDLTAFVNLLQEDGNVLAIQGLNVAADSPDFLVVPELSAAMTGKPLTFSAPLQIVARWELDGQWSRPVEAPFFVAGLPVDATSLAITEINYNPLGPTDAERAVAPLVEKDDFEFIELANLGSHAIDLTGIRLAGGVDFAFSGAAGLLAPGQYMLVVQNEQAFELRYGAGLPVVGELSGGPLSDGGDQIVLTDRFGVELENFWYDDAGQWPERAAGRGSSLELVDFQRDATDGANWRPSAEYGGSPGSAGVGPVGDVVINEVLTRSGDGAADQLELLNTTGQPIDVSGWFLSNDLDELLKFQIPAATTIDGGQTLVLDEPQLGFGLNGAQGGALWLLDTSDPTWRFADHASFDAADLGVSLGRWPDGAIGRPLVPLSQQTFGGPNSGPVVGPAIISEVQYNPPALADYREDFEQGTAAGFEPRLGEWTVRNGRYEVTPGAEQKGDSITIVPALQPVSNRFNIDTTLRIPGTSDFKKNAAVIFDYRSPTDFKFVSLHTGARSLRIGQRDATKWNFLVKKLLRANQLAADTDIDLTVAVNGRRVEVRMNGNIQLAYTFGSSVNLGSVGLGSKNGKALFESFSVERLGDQEFEFVELRNTTSEPLDLSAWRLTGGADWTLPGGTTVAPEGFLVAVGFNPADAAKAEGFRRQYNLDSSVVLVGPYPMELADDGQTVSLFKPRVPGDAASGRVLVDRMSYGDESPWPAAAAGGGRSLGRKTPEAFGDFAASWTAQVPSPGAAIFAEPGDLNVDGSIGAGDTEAFVLALRNEALYEATYGVPATVAGDLDQDGNADFDDIPQFRMLLDMGSEFDGGGAADFDDLSGILLLGQSGAGVSAASASGSATAEGSESLTATSAAEPRPGLVTAVFAEKESVDSLVAALRKPAVARASRPVAAAATKAGDWDLDGDVDFDDIARFRTLLK